MLHRELSKAIYEDRLADARTLRRQTEAARLRKAQRRHARGARKNMRLLRREAHRATVGAFVAFGDGIAKPITGQGDVLSGSRSGSRATSR